MISHLACHLAKATFPAGLALAVLIGSISPAADKDAPKTIDVKVKDLKLAVPADWTQEEPASSMRLSQFKIPPVEGDEEAAELVISSFKGGGGGVDPNLKRWIGEFAAEGRKVKLLKGDSKQGEYYLSDLTGTFNKRVGPFAAGKTTPVPGSRALGVILVVPDKDVYFLKLVGPEKTIKTAEKAFKSSFGADPEKEEAYELK